MEYTRGKEKAGTGAVSKQDLPGGRILTPVVQPYVKLLFYQYYHQQTFKYRFRISQYHFRTIYN